MKEVIFRNYREYKAFVDAMENELLNRNMSHQELADEIGVSVRSIYNFRGDKSRNPSRFLAGKIAVYLGIRSEQFRGL